MDSPLNLELFPEVKLRDSFFFFWIPNVCVLGPLQSVCVYVVWVCVYFCMSTRLRGFSCVLLWRISFTGSFPQDGPLHADVRCQPAMTKTSSRPATCPCGLATLHTHSLVCRKARFPVWQGLVGAGVHHILSYTLSSVSFVLHFKAFTHRWVFDHQIQLPACVYSGLDSA